MRVNARQSLRWALHLASAGLAVALLASCSSPAPTTRIEDVKPAAAPSAPSPADPADASCKDASKDGGNFDITKVAVERVGGEVSVAVTVRKLPSYTDTASAILSFYDPTGNRGGMFGTKWITGDTAPTVYVWDNTMSMNSYVQNTPTVAGKTITTNYPADLVGEAGPGWVWKVTTTIDGQDVDTCTPSGFAALPQ